MIRNIIDIKNVTHRYKGANKDTLSDVSLSVNEKETLLLCGASGSGKTSIIRLINGLIPHYYNGDLKGEVRVNGIDIKNIELFELAGVVGTVFQNPRSQFFSIDTDGEIVFGPQNIGLDPKKIIQRKEDIVKQMNLENLLNRSLFELSGGQKQRIACASVAALLPDVILLDEPSSNLDIESINNLHDIIKEWKMQGKTIIIAEHRLWYLKDLVDRVVYMKNSKIEKEWTKEEFTSIDDKELKSYKLRPLNIQKSFFDYDNKNEIDTFNSNEKITLKDFYFSYKKRPYLIRKKKFSYKDGDLLNLCIKKLSIPKGKVIGVVGKNGTGKSTFLRCVCGLEKDCTGIIECDGKVYKGKNKIGFSYMVMQDVNHQLFTDSVEKEVYLSMADKNELECHRILESLGIIEYKDFHPMALSGGQKQRVAIASAVASGAKLLLFDEPTSGLDYLHMEKVAKLLNELALSGNSVLVSTHDLELIDKCCDYLLCINNGKIEYFKKYEKGCNKWD